MNMILAGTMNNSRADADFDCADDTDFSKDWNADDTDVPSRIYTDQKSVQISLICVIRVLRIGTLMTLMFQRGFIRIKNQCKSA